MEAPVLEVILWFIGSFLVSMYLGREPEVDQNEIFEYYSNNDDVDGCK